MHITISDAFQPVGRKPSVNLCPVRPTDQVPGPAERPAESTRSKRGRRLVNGGAVQQADGTAEQNHEHPEQDERGSPETVGTSAPDK